MTERVLKAKGSDAMRKDTVMSRLRGVRSVIIAAIGILQAIPCSAANADDPLRVRVSDMYGKLPLSFAANRGQTNSDVKFLSRGAGHTLFLAPTEAVLVLVKPEHPSSRDLTARLEKPGTATQAVLRMTFVGANPDARVTGHQELPGKANYFLGKDPATWRTDVPTYAKVHYRDVYPGIDLVYYGNQRQLEYDFVVAPGADPERIALGFQGADRLDVDAQGDLVVHTTAGTIRQRKPLIYQEIDGARKEIPGGYVLTDMHRVSFRVAAYDATRPLVIDPVLSYSTYLGGSGHEEGFGIAVDAGGNVYVTGITFSSDFPTTAGALDTAFSGSSDAFVTKLNPTGSALVYSTYLGGSGSEEGTGIVVDADGNAYVTGTTLSTNFPTTAGAFDTIFGGLTDVFVTKLNPTGSGLVYSTYLGGSRSDRGRGIALDAAGNTFITGDTSSTNFPTTVAAVDTTLGGISDAFVTKLDPIGSALLYSTYLGGSGFDEGKAIAVDVAGNTYVTGDTSSSDFPTTAGAFDMTFNGGSADAFVAKLNPTGSTPLIYSAYLGGSDNDRVFGIAVDASGHAYVTGGTFSTDFPTTTGAFQTTSNSLDVFVAKVAPTGSALVYSTYLGGSSDDVGFGIALDALPSPNVYVTGRTQSTDFPTRAGAFDTTLGGSEDAFVVKFDSAGAALVYSTYLGGSAHDLGRAIALDGTGHAFLTGRTQSTDFPTTADAVQPTFGGSVDAFVAKIAGIGAPATLVLSPATATNPVEASHTVMATVTDAAGSPVPGVTVRFTVTGSVSASGSCTTDANGQCSVSYEGPPLPGQDAITAYADMDGDNTQDVGEPSGAAAKTWVLPASTPGCEVTNAGKITAANTDTATFSGRATASGSGQDVSGEQHYHDHGPVQRLKVRSINVRAVICSVDHTAATIFGEATIDGAGSVDYRIDVKDLGEPGKDLDVYGIVLSNGYASGDQMLEAGNVRITVLE